MAAVTHEGLIDLAAARVGGRALAASDEFFAPRHNLLAAGEAGVIEGKETHPGKKMGGGGTPPRRGPGGGCDRGILPPCLPRALRVGTAYTTHLPAKYP